MLAGYGHQVSTINFADQAADERLAVLRAPFGGATVKAAYAMASETVNAGTADYYSLVLQNGGSTGTATTAMGTAGGTAGWTADTSEPFTLNSSDELASGEWLMVSYDEEGTVAPGEISVVVEWVNGQG